MIQYSMHLERTNCLFSDAFMIEDMAVGYLKGLLYEESHGLSGASVLPHMFCFIIPIVSGTTAFGLEIWERQTHMILVANNNAMYSHKLLSRSYKVFSAHHRIHYFLHSQN